MRRRQRVQPDRRRHISRSSTRLSLAPGEPSYDADERRLAARPPITVPTITIGSDFDGPAKDGASHRTQQ
jgi:hypothetical protein